MRPINTPKVAAGLHCERKIISTIFIGERKNKTQLKKNKQIRNLLYPPLDSRQKQFNCRTLGNILYSTSQ